MIHTPSSLLLCAEQRTSDCVDLANQHFAKNFTVPQVSLNQRGKIAGTAHLHKNVIKLNHTLFSDNVAHFINEVIPHEVSHIIVFQQYGKVRPHGIHWKNVMQQVFGLPPNVRHSLDVTKVEGKTFSYYCDCGSIKLSIRRHNKIIKNKQTYICRKCHQVLSEKPFN